MMAHLSIIIPTMNRKDDLKKCLQIVTKQKYPGTFEIIVVDGASTDGTKDMVKKFKKVRFIIQKGKGPAAACNQGVKESIGVLLLFLDDDCVPKSLDWAETLSSEAMRRETVVGGRVVIPTKTFSQRYSRALEGFGTPDLGIKSITITEDNFNSLPSTNIAMPLELFKTIGGFNEQMVVGYDINFCQRAVKIKPMHYTPSAVVYHLHRQKVASMLRHAYKGMFWTTRSKINKNMTRKAFRRTIIIPFTLLFLFISTIYPLLLFLVPIALVGIVVRFILRKASWDAIPFSVLYLAQLFVESAGSISGFVRKNKFHKL